MAKTAQSAKRKAHPKSLTGITIEGFKCFREAMHVEIRPLTILAGANSGGKSSIIQPLLLMKQTLEAPFDPGPLLLDGPLVRLEEASTLFWKGKSVKDRADRWSIQTGGTDSQRKTTFARGGKKAGLKLESVEDLVLGITYREQMSESEVQHAVEVAIGSPLAKTTEGKASAWRVVRNRSMWTLEARMGPLSQFGFQFGPTRTDETLLDLIHLPGLRGNPLRAYPVTRATERFPGPFQNYTAGMLLGWKESDHDRLTAVGNDLRTLGLSWKVEPRQRGDIAVEVLIGRLPGPQHGGAMDMVNIADVGFGASQVLPVVVALQAAKPGQVVHIEQPELHLHPRAQRLMADLLIAAAKRGAIVIVETHSHVLLTAVQLRVADDTIAASDVALHWFERDEDGASHVRTADLDSAGAYGDWPVDFADVEMDVDRAYIDAAFRKLTP